MSAAEKLKALEQHTPGNHWDAEISVTLRNALSQIRAVVEAADAIRGELWQSGEDEVLAVPLAEWLPVRRTLAALDEALTTKGER